MKKINLLVILFVFFLSGKIFAQGMVPPPPIKSSFLDAVMGTWVSEPYKMMGMNMTDEVSHKMILNGQFMEIDITATAENGFVFQGMGIIAPSNDGSVTGTFYDIFGKNGITTYSGTSKDNNVYLTGTSAMGTESRDISIDGNTMIHNVTYNMKDANGNPLPTETFTIKYHKK